MVCLFLRMVWSTAAAADAANVSMALLHSCARVCVPHYTREAVGPYTDPVSTRSCAGANVRMVESSPVMCTLFFHAWGFQSVQPTVVPTNTNSMPTHTNSVPTKTNSMPTKNEDAQNKDGETRYLLKILSNFLSDNGLKSELRKV